MIHFINAFSKNHDIDCNSNISDVFKTLNKKQVTLEDGRLTKFYYNKIKIIDLCHLLLNMIGIFCCILYLDNKYQYNPIKHLGKSLLSISLACSILMAPLSILHCHYKVIYLKYKGMLNIIDSILTSGTLPYLILECLVNFIQPVVFIDEYSITILNDGIELTYPINDILSFLMLVRSWSIIELLLSGIEFNSNRADRICQLFGFRITIIYGMKSYFVKYPLRFVWSSILISVPIFALGIRIWERPLALLQPNNSLNLYTTCIWWSVVSITSIGYGDYYPQTLFGRIWAVFICIWGVFIVAIMVTAMDKTMMLENQQQKAFHIINKMRYEDSVITSASRVIINLWRIYKIYKEPRSRLKEYRLTFAIRNFRFSFYAFRQAKQQYIHYNTMFNIVDFLVITNDKLIIEFEELHVNQRKIYEGAIKAKGLIRINQIKETVTCGYYSSKNQ